VNPSGAGSRDQHFVDAVTRAADLECDRLYAQLGTLDAPGLHALGPRRVMASAKALAAVALWGGSRHRGSAAVLGAVGRLVSTARGLLGPSGLFSGDGNVESPPDSAFTVVDLCDLYELLNGDSTGAASGVAPELEALAHAVRPALLAGGVHTANHRWQLSAALAALHRSWPHPSLAERVEAWLAEGVDVHGDGTYSERSPNYAAHVSNPSLILIADVLGRPELLDVVERNLESTLAMVLPDGTVETVQSRRQDQGTSFALADYLLQLRRMAIGTGRGDFSWAADLALQGPVRDAGRTLAAVIARPALAAVLPAPVAPPLPRLEHLADAGLVAHVTGRVHVVAYGGSDYARFRRARSGLAHNPTFLRMFAGQVVLGSVRLSRDFFGLGPFRAGSACLEGDRYVMEEAVSGAYYQPLAPGSRRADGQYRLEDEGRFVSAMSFSDRAADVLGLRTRVQVRLAEDGAEVTLRTEGPPSAWALELAFRPGGELEVVEDADGPGELRPTGPGQWELVRGTAAYRVGPDVVRFGPGNGTGPDRPPAYWPGEDYTYLGATDAAEGERVYITGRAPGTAVLLLQRVGA
jgi:hypothetical protein